MNIQILQEKLLFLTNNSIPNTMIKCDLNNLFSIFDYCSKYTNKTEFYNEGWLTRILIYAVNDYNLLSNDLYIKKLSTYHSEAMLTTPFLAYKVRKDKLAEDYTRADGVIGQVEIGYNNTKSLVKMTHPNLTVIEAKIKSKFSTKVTNANFYNQAARYIACIAKTVEKSKLLNKINSSNLKFRLLVPKDQYDRVENSRTKYRFSTLMKKDSIKETVNRRVEQYKDRDDYAEKKRWFDDIFLKVLEEISIEKIFYDDIIDELKGYKYHKSIAQYYKDCLEANGVKSAQD